MALKPYLPKISSNGLTRTSINMNLSKIKKIRPLYNKVLITADRFTEDQVSDSGIIDPTKQHGVLMPVQKVVAIGPMVRDVKEGDVVCFNPTRYGKTVQVKDENSIKGVMESHHSEVRYNFPVINIDGTDFLYIYDSDIDYVIEEYEEVKSGALYTPDKKLKTPKIR